MDSFNRILGQWRQIKSNPLVDFRQKMLRFCIHSSFHSVKIDYPEVFIWHMEELFEKGNVEFFSGDPITLQMLYNQKKWWEHSVSYLHESSQLCMSMTFIKNMHKILTEGMYSTHYVLRGNAGPGKIRAKSNASAELAKLLKEIKALGSEEIFRGVAYLAIRFMKIMPFLEGNGMIMRMLLNTYLIVNEYPPIIMFEDDYRFFEQLLLNDVKGLDGMMYFLQKQMTKTWTNCLIAK